MGLYCGKKTCVSASKKLFYCPEAKPVSTTQDCLRKIWVIHPDTISTSTLLGLAFTKQTYYKSAEFSELFYSYVPKYL